MSRSAESQAFSIVEIFELILLQLDHRTLLTKAQIICHAWTTFIQQSPAIQWALFFKPITNIHSKKYQNSLLAEVFPSIFNQYGRATQTVPKNEEEGNDAERNLFTFATFDMVLNPHKWDAYMRPEASWRRMLVQQPPVYTVSLLRCSLGHGGRPFYHNEALDNPKELSNGLRMEIVLEALVFGEMTEEFESQVTEMVWGSEELPKLIRKELELFGLVDDYGLIFLTSVGWARRRQAGFLPDLERKIVKSVKEEYERLGLEPKYSEEAFVKKRRSWGSLWD